MNRIENPYFFTFHYVYLKNALLQPYNTAFLYLEEKSHYCQSKRQKVFASVQMEHQI